jgi:hypothetical protein
MPDLTACANTDCPRNKECGRYFEHLIVVPRKSWSCKWWQPDEREECEGFIARNEDG